MDQSLAINSCTVGSDQLCCFDKLSKKEMDIINAIINGATTVEDVRKQTYATMGSGCCKQQVERLIECLCEAEDEE